jgi:hypothetical protein
MLPFCLRKYVCYKTFCQRVSQVPQLLQQEARHIYQAVMAIDNAHVIKEFVEKTLAIYGKEIKEKQELWGLISKCFIRG